MPKTKIKVAETLKLVRLELPAGLHAQLRVQAARHQIPMSQYVRRLVEKNLEKNPPVL